MHLEPNMALSGPYAHRLNLGQKSSLGTVGLGLLGLAVGWGGHFPGLPAAVLLGLALALVGAGALGYAYASYAGRPAGIQNTGLWQSALTARGWSAWLAAIVLTGFYVLLYWFPALLGLGQAGAANRGLIALFDPLSHWLKGSPASQWFVYGTLYTLAILAMGAKFIAKYRHNRYQVWRTLSVMFFQLGFAFLLPELLLRLKYPYHDFKNMWPLNYYFFDEWSIKGMLGSGRLGLFMLASGVAMVLLVSPVLTYFYGKRWYCSWVCGCGGLAETAGDPFRHLSDKSLRAWRIERWMIHGVLLLAVLMSVGVLYSFFHNNPQGFWLGKGSFTALVLLLLGGGAALLRWRPRLFGGLSARVRGYLYASAAGTALLLVLAYASGTGNALVFVDSYQLRSWYGFLIGAAFSGVVGVGFYPLLGSRVWCRFGCPMAAILGLQQRFFSRFRITVNGGQCISCGNCSTFCEMGIDVRHYAQRGQDVLRASCVGCGICAAVCPRGVLRLENAASDVGQRAEALRVLHITPEGGVQLPL